ncbi:MAG: LicD family protein [Selenomonadaceae bacterium]|nr:LicD family protein [Selenomonadaceae bacterium]
MENYNQNLIRQNELLANQNKMLSQINELMLRQNKIIQQQGELLNSAHTRETFVENIDRDEMRNGFLVTSHRKKLWNVQIGLINEFARICKKYSLKWFAYGGTLLGAVRHKGFIPWDDDVDVAMFRPDYEKFKKIVMPELQPQFKLDNWYNYRLEADEYEYSEEEKNNLPLITIEQTRKYPMWWPCRPMIRIIDRRTTMVDLSIRKKLYSGIWIDVFPFDVVPPISDEKRAKDFEVRKTLHIASSFPTDFKEAADNGSLKIISKEDMYKFLKMPYRQRGMVLDDLNEKAFVNPERVAEIQNYWLNNKRFSFDKKALDKITYLPFEKIQIPVPVGWEHCLTSEYGNWRKMKITHAHSSEYSVDIPYTEYFAKSPFMR